MLVVTDDFFLFIFFFSPKSLMVLLRFMETDCNKEEYFFNFSQLRFITIFRSVATSDCWAPTAATSARARRLSETETHNYANFPGMAHGNHMNSDDKNFLPGIYAVSLQMFTRFKVAKDIDSFHLCLFDFPFIYQFHFLMTTLVKSAFWNPADLPIFKSFQQHFSIFSKFVCCGFYIKNDVAFTLISFALPKWDECLSVQLPFELPVEIPV